MARTPTPRQTENHLLDLDPEAVQQDLTAANTLVTLKAGISADRDLLNQLLGQAQMADAFAKFSVTVTTSKLAYVKENKLYQQLRGTESGNGYQYKGTWEEFCELLGTSREKADLDIANLKSFGESALESMSRMGIGYRDLRQFRKLPEDAKPLLIEAAKSGDKDAFMDLAEELVERHVKQKTELEGQLAEAQATVAAKEQVAQDLSAELLATQEKLARPWTPNLKLAARNAQDEASLVQLEAKTKTTEVEVRALALVVASLCEQGDGALRSKALGAVEYVLAVLREVVLAHGLEVEVSDASLGVRPTWMTWADAAPSTPADGTGSAAR